MRLRPRVAHPRIKYRCGNPMKYTFVVDENILICGARGVDEHDNDDTTSSLFLSLLLKNCHMIMVDPHIMKKYRQRLDGLKVEANRGFIDPQMFSVLGHIVYHHDKLLEFGNSISSEVDLGTIPRKDRELAGLAYHLGLTVVTLDERLRSSINEHPSFMTKQLKALHPREALKIVKEI